MGVYIYICSKKASKSSSNIHPSTTTLSVGSFGVHTEQLQRAPQSQSSLILTLSGSLLFSELLAAGDGGLDADAAEHEADAEDLHRREPVPEGYHRQDHREHLARHRHRHQEHRGEGRERVDWESLELASFFFSSPSFFLGLYFSFSSFPGSSSRPLSKDEGTRQRQGRKEDGKGTGGEGLTDEDLADGAAGGEAEEVAPDGGVAGHEGEGLAELAGAAGGVHAEPVAEAGADEPGAAEEVGGGDGGGHEVVGAHHLRARVRPERAEHVVLRAVGQPVEEQVDAEQQQAPGRPALRVVAAAAAAAAGMLLRLPRVQREDGNAGRHGGHDEVLVERVAAAEEGDVKEHDGEQLAALGEQEGDVVDVSEGGVAEGAGQGARQRDQQQRRQDAPRRDHRRHPRPPRRAPPQVRRPRQRRERRLDRVQEHRVLEEFGRLGRVAVPAPADRAVWRRREFLL